MNEYLDNQEIDESYSDSLHFNLEERNEHDELQEHTNETNEYFPDPTEKDRYISDLQLQYEQAKMSIELSRSKEEKEFWIKRSDELWNEKDLASFTD